VKIARRSAAATTVLGAAAGALLSAALLGGPVAHADVFPTLPVPPFDYDKLYDIFYPEHYGTMGDITNGVGSETDFSSSFDQAYSAPMGSFEVHEVGIHPLYQLPGIYGDYTETVTSSSGVAPAVGTVFNDSYSQLDLGLGGTYTLFNDLNLTTPDGTVGVFLFGNSGWENQYYQGPAGTADYLVNGYGTPDGVTYTLFDFPAAGDTAAAINPADLAGLADAHSLAADIPSLF
jgi:hypothetical protein